MLEMPDTDVLKNVNDVSVADFPEFAPVEVTYDQPQIDDIEAVTTAELEDFSPLASLEEGAEIGLTAGSRGIHDMPAILQAAVEYLTDEGFEPFVFPAMGSHGGATAEGQRELLESLGITEETMGCEIRSSMDVMSVGEAGDGRPVFAATDAIEADAVILANRVKLHTDFAGDIESGLTKMSVIGLGKQRGAEAMHKGALANSFEESIRERASVLFEETPIVGGIAMIENAEDRAAHIEAVPVEEIFDREPALLERSEEYLPMIPTEDLDVLVVDEIGKNVSGTGMDTNVIGRIDMLGEAEPETPDYTRIYVRSITEESHGNGIGMGLADFVHQRVVEQVDLNDVYVNVLTAGEPARSHIPLIAPTDAVAMQLLAGCTGVKDPADLRIARIQNTMEVDRVLVSEPVAADLESDENVSVGELAPLEFDGEDLATPFYAK
ncbi:MAG: lactate racemase domain-containing protein [Halodesulfurarchaeum sp.]